MVGITAALVVALTWSFVAVRVGDRLGLVDTPGSNALKVHDRPVSLLGGIGVFAGVHLGLAIEGLFDPALLVASGIVLILGLVDDALGLSPRTRVGVEFVAAVVLAGFVESGLRTPAGFVVGVIFAMVAINAVNLLDGLDGLVGSVTVVSGLAIAGAGLAGFGEALFGFVLAAATIGFLVFNWKPARIFLGDNGAYTIGILLAYATIKTAGSGIVTMSLVATGVMGVFFIDLIATILRRKLHNHPLFSGDRSHVYDQLRDRGWTVPAVATAAAAVQAILGGVYIGLAAANLPSIVGIVSIVVGVLLTLFALWRFGFVAKPGA